MKLLELLQFLIDNANENLLTNEAVRNRFKEILKRCISNLDKEVTNMKQFANTLHPLVTALSISYKQDEELFKLCLRTLARLLKDEKLAFEVVKENKLIPLLLGYLEEYTPSKINATTTPNYDYPERMLLLLSGCAAISIEVNQLLVINHKIVPKLLSIFDAENTSASTLNERVVWVISHLLNSSDKSIRNEVLQFDIVNMFLPYFVQDRVYLRKLSYFPDELLLDEKNKADIIELCKANLNIHKTLFDLDSLVILCNLNPNLTIIRDIQFNNLDLDELKRISTKIFKEQLTSPKSIKAVNINQDKSKDVRIYKDINFISGPLNCLVSFKANRARLYSPELVQSMVAALCTLEFLTLTNRMQIVRTLHKFALSVPQEEAEAAFGTIDNYNKFKNVYEAFYSLQVCRFFQPKDKQLPDAAIKLIGYYGLGGFSLPRITESESEESPRKLKV